MNGAHFHLLVNHLPVLGILFGLLTLAAGFVFKNGTVKRTALGILIFASIAVFPTHKSGEEAEEVVEDMNIVEHSYIHTHEEAADLFMKVVIGLGILAIATFVLDVRNHKQAPMLYVVTLLFAVGTMYFAQKASNTGGKVRHTEIRAGAPSAPAAGQATPTEHDDD